MSFPLRTPHLTILLFAILLAACSAASAPEASTPQASPMPEGPQTLNICMATEPSSLYIYADNSSSARAVRQALFDGPFDLVNYQPHGVIFEGQPSATRQSVTVRQGDTVVDAAGNVVALTPGVRLRPSGCQDGNCELVYSEGDIQMDQVQVHFTLQAGLHWSDGTPLTAHDSVYSFQVAAANETPGTKDIIHKTASYTAVDERNLTWLGLPGYIDPQASTRFWHPLPQHQLGSLPAADLMTNELSNRTPLGWGPYSMGQWVAGERIQLTRNNHYAGPAAKFAELNFVFIGEDGAASSRALAEGRCDLLLPSAGLGSAEAAGHTLLQQDQWLHLVFGITPQAYDDGFNIYTDRASYFGDVGMRQALAQCIDRNSIANAIHGVVASGYLPSGSPYANGAATLPGYDPAAANASLDAQGWLLAEDGLRRSQSFPAAIFGQALELRLAVSDDPQDLAVASILQSNLAACGIALTIESMPIPQLFSTGPEAPVFGRNFDLALFAWPFGELPACYLFLGEAVPSGGHKYGWGGWNVSGWQNAEFDAACHTALNTLASDPAHSQAQQTAQAIFAQQLPALPLAVPYGVLAARPDFCGLEAADGQYLLQGIENYGYGSLCQ